MRIVQFINSKTGNAVKNHFCIIDGNTETFQSYDSKIAIIDHDKKILTIGNKWDFSTTTTKHFCNWLTQIFDADTPFKMNHIKTMIELGFVGDYQVIYNKDME